MRVSRREMPLTALTARSHLVRTAALTDPRSQQVDLARQPGANGCDQDPCAYGRSASASTTKTTLHEPGQTSFLLVEDNAATARVLRLGVGNHGESITTDSVH